MRETHLVASFLDQVLYLRPVIHSAHSVEAAARELPNLESLRRVQAAALAEDIAVEFEHLGAKNEGLEVVRDGTARHL